MPPKLALSLFSRLKWRFPLRESSPEVLVSKDWSQRRKGCEAVKGDLGLEMQVAARIGTAMGSGHMRRLAETLVEKTLTDGDAERGFAFEASSDFWCWS